MNEHPVHHGAFTIERVYDAPPQSVFEAFADDEARKRWGAPQGHEIDFMEMDFRAGGRDLCRCGPSGNLTYLVETRYHDIVPGQRIVFGETVSQGEARLAASLITVELMPEGNGTRLTLTDQIASFVGAGMVSGSKGGYGAALDNLAGELTRDAGQDRRGMTGDLDSKGTVAMATPSKSETVRALFAAYRAKDRAAGEKLLTEDFTFTSPYDDHLDKAAYFERCWPNSDLQREFEIEALAEAGTEVFVRYRCLATTGKEFRNVEVMGFTGDRISSVAVYFGATWKDGAFLPQATLPQAT